MATSSRRSSILVSQLAAARAGGSQQEILDELRRVILDGGVPPGTAIPVGEIAELFGVSAIPVRESLKTLIGESLVSHRPNAGYVVAELTWAELKEMYLIRGVLESTALSAAVSAISESDVVRAVEAHAALNEAIATGDLRGYHRESRRFHLALIAPCRMQRVLRMFEAAWNITEPAQPMKYLAQSERERLHADHEQMLAAFVARDALGLVQVSRLHHQRLESAIAALPDRFGTVETDS